jgi:uncharacterized protein (UPF0335 family)
MSKNKENTGIASEQLASYIERIERLVVEKEHIQADIKQVKAEAKAVGFDIPTINALLKLRKMEDHEREEYEALLDIYKAALGMLYDTPLGEAARRRLSESKGGNSEQSDLEDFTGDKQKPDAETGKQSFTDETTIDEATDMGTKAAKDGAPVTRNPFPAQDPRRAAWDQAWCKESKSDGMDIPEAWRRTKPKKEKTANDDDGQSQQEAAE